MAEEKSKEGDAENGVAEAAPTEMESAPTQGAPEPATEEATSGAPVSEMPMPEARDLSPEDIAALYPTTHADREPPEAGVEPNTTALPTSPEDANAAALSPNSPADSLPPNLSFSVIETQTEMPPPPASTPMADAGASAQVEQLAMQAATAALAQTAEPAVAAVAPAPGTGAKSEVASSAVSAAAVSGGAGDNRTVVVAAAASKAFRVSEDQVGVTGDQYEYVRPTPLPSQPELVSLFVNDGRLMTIWLDIDSVEAQVVTTPRAGKKLVQEMLDRLATARNLLMNNRDQVEEAQREIAQVKYLLTRLNASGKLQQPFSIVLYLIIWLVLLVLGFLSGAQVQVSLGSPSTLVGIPFLQLWNAIMWGGLGGLSAAFYGLIRHVEDYDPQHARWYFLSPIMGWVFGPLIAMLAQIGFAGVVAVVSSGNVNVDVNPVVLYLLAWVVGFQQNLLLKVVNSVLKQLYPDEDKSSPK